MRLAFGRALDQQRGTGAAVAVWHAGRWVVDLWGGAVDAARTRAWRADSIVQTYSVTKPFAAMCALHLVDCGRLDLDAPMQRYWPEFTARASVRQVLSHQAGVVALDTPVPTAAFYDWDWMCTLLAAQAPEWQPGTAHGESALFYGHLVGELVRRVDGRSLGRYLHEEICRPAGLDFAVGLSPADQARAAELTGFADLAPSSTSGLYARATGNPPGLRDPAVVNSAPWRAAEIPAVNGHGTARGAAGLYAALLDGGLLSPGLLSEATTAQCSGPDAVFGHVNAWGLGFAVDEDGFGMGGTGGSYAGASPQGNYAIGFVTGSMGSHARALSVENAVRTCVGLPPL